MQLPKLSFLERSKTCRRDSRLVLSYPPTSLKEYNCVYE